MTNRCEFVLGRKQVRKRWEVWSIACAVGLACSNSGRDFERKDQLDGSVQPSGGGAGTGWDGSVDQTVGGGGAGAGVDASGGRDETGGFSTAGAGPTGGKGKGDASDGGGGTGVDNPDGAANAGGSTLGDGSADAGGSTHSGGSANAGGSTDAGSTDAGGTTITLCPTLSNPDHGNVSVTGRTSGSAAAYYCNMGYTLTGNASSTCGANGQWSGTPPTCVRPPSCAGDGVGADFKCGESGNDDCCSSLEVTGGTFNRGNDSKYPAKVATFRLDKYEITVGRFRAFVTAGRGTQGSPPGSGTGQNPNVAGSGWDSSWNTNLVASGALGTTVGNPVQCDSATSVTWSAGDDRRPMNCITWYEAFAFCIWDGGRLPTDLEWNYAAAGGNEQRPYPWAGGSEPGANAVHAIYHCYYGTEGGTAPTCSGPQQIAPVGSAPSGNGRWGQADLAGNVREWVLDWSSEFPTSFCDNCAKVAIGYPPSRVVYNGDFQATAEEVSSFYRFLRDPPVRDERLGFRCARNP